MNSTSDKPIQPAVLPELEHLLVRAARHRAAPRFGRRRWSLAVAAAALLLLAGVAGAATGVLKIAGGSTSDGSFVIEGQVAPPGGQEERDGSICLQLSFADRGSAYGCGDEPSAEKPFGLVIADPLGGGGERVVYGLVSDDIARVSVFGGGGSHVDAATRPKAELPGRFFSVVAPNDGRIELIGHSVDGKEIARLGGLDEPSQPPLSKAQAMAQGDPAGFAPGIAPPSSYDYKGEDIGPGVATRLELVCLQGRDQIRCYDSEEEMEAAQGGP